ncbi:hypothetical protein [uncultured Rhodospira sp.]|uniref:hypothetical protein n=1 Tax=uncultured Rhodospira sp. TaxID=1936189 RepID=UPI00262864D2|nr:hypothetical protein [uncultured Rhodospira sp.]
MTALIDIAFAPLVPPVLLGALAVVLAVLTALAVWRRARGALVRILPGAALLLVLANPQGVVEEREPLSDVAVIAVDDSASNRLDGRTARTVAALAAVREALGDQPDLEVRVVHVTEDGADRGTRLLSAVRGALADVPPARRAGVIALTDGRVHDADTLDAQTLAAPLHVLLTGRPDEVDRRLVVEAAPGYGLVGREMEATVRLLDPSLPDGTPVLLNVSRDGLPAGMVTVPANRAGTVTLALEHAGDTVFDLRAGRIEGEVTPLNNRAAISINGVRDRLRVLLISGEPHAGERVWRNLLKADPNVDLVHFTILRPPHKDDSTPLHELALISFPVAELFEQRLDDFDLIIFDRYSRRGLVPPGYLANVADAVRRGGALLLAVGPEFADALSLYDSALAEVLPMVPTRAVIDEAFRPLPTPVGRRHPVTGGLPGLPADPDAAPAWGPWVRLVEASATGGETLLTGPGARPALVLARAGEGRVGVLLSDTVWLWAKGFEGGGPQADMLRRVAHWLMKEPELEEESLRADMVGDGLEVTRRGLDPAAMPDQVRVTDPLGATHTLDLVDQGDGRAVATLPDAAPGVHTLNDGTLVAMAVAGTPNPRETDEVTATPEALAPLVEASGGGVHWLATDGPPTVRRVAEGRATAGPGWIGLRDSDAYRVVGVDQAALLPPWLGLLLVLGGLGLAWWREGR